MSEGVLESRSLSIRGTVAGAAFTALTAVGAYISIPIGPVPIVLQNFFVILAGLLLGPVRGLVSVTVYLLIGAVGLPVFAGGTGGIGHFFGPTGGYLVGFLPAVFLTGLISHGALKLHGAGSSRATSSTSSGKRLDGGLSGPGSGSREPSVLRHVIAAAAGALVVYMVGVPWLKAATGMAWGTSLGAGLIPFIPGDAVKVLAAAFTARSLAPRFASFLGGSE